jgi:hypothetical protein
MAKKVRGQKTICIPVPSETDYGKILDDLNQYQAYLDDTIQLHPELFPPSIGEGYRFYGTTYSPKQQLKMRRIQLLSNGEVYQLRPDFVMPYMIAHTDAVEKALYLRRYGVPYEALAYVFGRNAMYWYRAEQRLGKFSFVARECILGVDLIPSASTKDLAQGYGTFRQEALNLNPDYRPQTVNTDGWFETQAAWKQ